MIVVVYRHVLMLSTKQLPSMAAAAVTIVASGCCCCRWMTAGDRRFTMRRRRARQRAQKRCSNVNFFHSTNAMPPVKRRSCTRPPHRQQSTFSRCSQPKSRQLLDIVMRAARRLFILQFWLVMSARNEHFSIISNVRRRSVVYFR